ncbi:SctD/MshK family protein [Paracoccus laeviglucosivorans]|uniref:Type III secretion protein D n=1 Tax=Paracoccus laeviglucosivorans TaxID=1197861 RepID=A0A521BDF7_9RHOB|nr:hypothetical protein [Paracoccus laeviglucosivorans]SMO45124.1 hypothetical protein SAMN06265221_102247 [Paracoccus laeviglucosivorans]
MTTQAKPYLLTVLTGPNAGAAAGFAPGKISIGGGADDQIILSGVAPGSLALRAAEHRLRLAASAPDIAFHDAQTGELTQMGQGAVHELPLPATLHLNEQTTIVLSRLGPPQRRGIGLQTGLGIAALAMALGLWIGAQFGGPANLALAALPEAANSIAAPPDAPDQQAVIRAARNAALVATSPRIECGADCVANVAAAFEERLAQAGLEGLSLAVDQGVLRVTGTLTPEQAEIWRQLRARFESENGQSLPLITKISEGEPEPVLAVASVWLGKTPEIRTKGGTILRIGDETGDGWTVDAITREAIRLSRGERHMIVRF